MMKSQEVISVANLTRMVCAGSGIELLLPTPMWTGRGPMCYFEWVPTWIWRYADGYHEYPERNLVTLLGV